MVDSIPLGAGQLTAVGVLTIVYFLIITGRLVPKIFYDAKAKESEQWREAYLGEREARIESEKQTTQLLELAKTSDSFIRAVFVNSQKEGASDEMANTSKKNAT